MNEIMEILHEINPHGSIDGRSDLFSSGILDSMSIIMLATEINDRYDVEIKAADITPENFDSPENILRLVSRLRAEES